MLGKALVMNVLAGGGAIKVDPACCEDLWSGEIGSLKNQIRRERWPSLFQAKEESQLLVKRDLQRRALQVAESEGCRLKISRILSVLFRATNIKQAVSNKPSHNRPEWVGMTRYRNLGQLRAGGVSERWGDCG